MAITARFTKAEVSRTLNNFLQAVEQQQIRRLQQLGEMCVSHARQVPGDVGFIDRTSNLRSSMGYAVYRDGVAVTRAFEVVSTGTESGEKGVKEGRKLADEVAREYPKGLLLVVTAGMEYASILESRNLDVLTSAEDLARDELPKLLKRLQTNINSALS